MLIPTAIFSDATISPCGNYRYMLCRIWDPDRPVVVFCGLNPSTADELTDDPTLRKCMHYANAWGFGGLYMINLFAWRTPSPEAMVEAAKQGNNVMGPDNAAALQNALYQTNHVVCMWGKVPKRLEPGCLRLIRSAIREVLLPKGGGPLFIQVSCFGTNQDGSPKHPLYLSEDLWPEAYSLSGL